MDQNFYFYQSLFLHKYLNFCWRKQHVDFCHLCFLFRFFFYPTTPNKSIFLDTPLVQETKKHDKECSKSSHSNQQIFGIFAIKINNTFPSSHAAAAAAAAAAHARATSRAPNCIMNHWTSVNVLFPVTKPVHGSSVQFFHNVHCSLWYVLGHKCLALLPWQPKAASGTQYVH